MVFSDLRILKVVTCRGIIQTKDISYIYEGSVLSYIFLMFQNLK